MISIYLYIGFRMTECDLDWHRVKIQSNTMDLCIVNMTNCASPMLPHAGPMPVHHGGMILKTFKIWIWIISTCFWWQLLQITIVEVSEWLAGGSPQSLDALFHGNSSKNGWSLGVPPWLGKPLYIGCNTTRHFKLPSWLRCPQIFGRLISSSSPRHPAKGWQSHSHILPP